MTSASSTAICACIGATAALMVRTTDSATTDGSSGIQGMLQGFRVQGRRKTGSQIGVLVVVRVLVGLGAVGFAVYGWTNRAPPAHDPSI